MTEKQAWIVGGGTLAVLFLMKSKAGAAPVNKLGTKGTTVSSALRPSANQATSYGTATRPQPASTVGAPSATSAAGIAAIVGGFLNTFLNKNAAGNTAPSAPKRDPGASAGGGSGGSSAQAAKAGYQAPGGNPWSSTGDFTGKSGVTSSLPANGNALQGYDTGVSSASGSGGDIGLPGGAAQNTDLLNAAYEADGTASDDPAAIAYDDPGYVDYGNSAGSEPVDASAALAPLDSTQTVPNAVTDSFGGSDVSGGDYVDSADDYVDE